MPDARRRGRPPRIDRARIVAVARTMDPSTLTMQAVAERLGVDRKALNYHVTDRDGLLELVAREALSDELAGFEPPAGASWPEVLRAFARQTRAGMVRTGAHFDHVRLPLGTGVRAMEPAEHLLRTLLDAGFEPSVAGRALSMLAELMYASARDAILIHRLGEHPQITELNRMLAEADPADLPAIRRLRESGEGMDDEQFEFDLDVLIAGLEARLAPGR
ncbi:TetR/AcrR family transcriptional regulator C-terminal domain-containing protein [Actinoplanes subtropicus]|uniref:TetR/AcrR family transcriptional regulator C-terminal domain-containing protein n=1 Tax=Actinoplanes subtropicus TaxID=543632 RepID=UPI0004C37964|nr:TetR/AcrR family transcriptional regulator C-terminal domain-containing protein [Actinoplanes subtropicus]